jgi:2-methylcitrate dehydratase PrpD
MSHLMDAISNFVSTIGADDIPPHALRAAKEGMLDCVGVMIAGSDEAAVRLVAESLRSASGENIAPTLPFGRMLDAADAALANGVAAHVLDYDDVGIDGHPSAVLTPAILAEAWARNAGGEEALSAYVAGYEVWAFLEQIEPGHMHNRGFHPTALWGTLATAAACSRLNRLNADQTSHAIGIAASLASGLVSNFGTMTKSLHAGRAAQSGIVAARLAKAGFTASADALDHPAGFLMAHSPSGSPDLSEREYPLGRIWQLPIQGLNIKRYPMCYATHRSIDGVLALVQQHDVKTEDIARIDVRIGETQLLMLRNHSPRTALEGKFSIEFALAAAVIARRVGLSELSDAFVTRPDVVALMKKVHYTTTSEIMKDLPFAPEDIVSISLASGTVLEHPPIPDAKGSWKLRMTENELSDKFRDCTEPVLGAAPSAALLRFLWKLEEAGSVRDLPLQISRAA